MTDRNVSCPSPTEIIPTTKLPVPRSGTHIDRFGKPATRGNPGISTDCR